MRKAFHMGFLIYVGWLSETHAFSSHSSISPIHSPIKQVKRRFTVTSAVSHSTPVGKEDSGEEQAKQAKQPNNNHNDIPLLTQVDVIYGSRTSLVYDDKKERFLPKSAIRKKIADFNVDSTPVTRLLGPVINSTPVRNCREIVVYNIKPILSAAFMPEGVLPSFYRYTRWRFLQRWVNGNLQVFGTKSLLLGLGIKTKSLAATSAALNWVLKDALGKIVRMMWASKMGGRFDSDAKRWRFRASLLYAMGNGLEIITYIFPQLFLLFAATANCCKQMSMLTCSSTRTAIYNSFRDGTRENIGDITAKGEASIAVVDLIGIATGVALSWLVGTSIGSVLAAYVTLQTIEVFCIYRMMRTVQFRVLNFERLVQVLQDFINESGPGAAGVSSSQGFTPHPATTLEPTRNGLSEPKAAIPMDMKKDAKKYISTVKTPEQMGEMERIIRPPKHLSRRALAFGSLGRARLKPSELTELIRIFSGEKYLVVVGRNMKNSKRMRLSRLMRHIWTRDEPTFTVQENCHIVLHTEATNADIVKSALALMLLRQKLSKIVSIDTDQIRSSNCFDLLSEACNDANRLLPRLLKQLALAGWTSPARFMFGGVTMRADWPLQRRRTRTKDRASKKDF